MPTIDVRCFAAARAALGFAHESVPVPDGVTVAQVVDGLAARSPEAGPVLARCAVLLDGARAERGAVVRDGARVDLLPPFAGG